MDTGVSANRRALKAKEAGAFLAELIGVADAFTAQKLWRLARSKQLPFIRIGREVWFQTDALRSFAECEASSFGKRGGTTEK